MSPLARGGEIKTNPPGFTRDRKTLERWACAHPWKTLRIAAPMLGAMFAVVACVTWQVHPVATIAFMWLVTTSTLELAWQTSGWFEYRRGRRDGFQAGAAASLRHKMRVALRLHAAHRNPETGEIIFTPYPLGGPKP